MLVSYGRFCAQNSDTTSGAIESATEKRLVYELFNQIFTAAEAVESSIQSRLGVQETPTSGLEVFAWHPNWIEGASDSYRYDQLTTLSYFSCTMFLGPFENLDYKEEGWESEETDEMVSKAKANNCNVLLTLKCHEAKAIECLLKYPNEQGYCIQYLMDKVTRGQDIEGINVVFEDIPEGYKDELSQFISDLSDSLKTLDKSLVLALPAVPDDKRYDFEALIPSVEQFVIMGYNYYYKKSKTAGPVSPILSGDKWGTYNLQNSLDGYLQRGIHKGRLIVALPYYGAVWEIVGDNEFEFLEHRRVNKILEDLGGLPPEIDEVSSSAFYHYVDGDRQYVCYFDNPETLKMKLDWVQSQGIAGAGIWALGYDDGYSDMWDAWKDYELVKNPGFNNPVDTTTFVSDTSALNLANINPQGALVSFEQAACVILKQREVIMVIGVILLGFVLIGVVLALLSSEVYEKFLIQEWGVYLRILGFYLAFILVCIAVSGFVFDDNSDVIASDDVISVLIQLGILGGAIISALSWKVFLKLNKDVP